MKNIILATLISSSILFGTEIKKIEDKTIIIYNDLALINNKGEVKVDNGISELSIPNISSNLIPDSVSINFNNKNIFIMEQNYKYDILNFDSILKYNLNKSVIYKEQSHDLISINNGCVLKNTLNNLILNVDCNQIQLKNIQDNIISEPNLNWVITNKNKEMDINFDLNYLTNGFSWNSNYVANIKDNNIYLNAWINITNNSDTSLKDYKLILLAGKPNIIQEENVMPRAIMIKSMAMENNIVNEVKENSFSGYHTYKIPFKVDIPKQSIKQIAFINKKIENYNIEYKVELNNYENKEKIKFDKIVNFVNEEKNGLGIPLPSGKIRFYQEDAEKINYFIGENRIEDTPKNEKLSLKIGKDFDSILEVKLLEQVQNDNKQLHKMEYTIKNNSNENKTYVIKQINPIYNIEKKNIDIDTTCKNKCNYIFENTKYIIYNINLDKNSEFNFITNLKN